MTDTIEVMRLVDDGCPNVDPPDEATVEGLLAENAALRAERDALEENFAAFRERAYEEAHRLREVIADLKAALKPFADYAGIVWEGARPTNPIGDACPPPPEERRGQNWRCARPLPTLGDCRRAAELLAAANQRRAQANTVTGGN